MAASDPKEFFMATQKLAGVALPETHLLRYTMAEDFYNSLAYEIDSGEFAVSRDSILRYGSQTIADAVRHRFYTMKDPGDIDLMSTGAPIEDMTRLCRYFAGVKEGRAQHF